MYLKTGRRVRRKRIIPLWRIALWLFAPLLIFVGIGLYQNRAAYIPRVTEFFDQAVVQAVDVVETIQAPTSTPMPDPSSTILRAEAAWSQGAYSDAVELYESILPAIPNDVKAHYFLTLGLINEGRDQDALEAAEDTVTANPFSSDAWAIRAMALNRAGRYGESIASALRAIELNPESARAHAFLAESFFDMGQIARAQSEVEQAIELDPDGFEAYYVRARINAESLYEFDAAKQDLEIAYDNSRGMPYIGVTLATEFIYRDLEDTASAEEGLARLQEMSERNPNNSLVLFQLGRYFRSIAGDLDQASTYLTRCVSAVPDSTSCHYLLGRVQNDQEQPEIAAESFVRAVESGSNNPLHFYWAGEGQLAVGNCTVAADYLRTGHQIAQETNSEWLDDLETLMRSVTCETFDLPTPTPTETLDLTVTEEPEA
jgi:tetratricopeptide (TPR) repeat protein